MYISDSKILGFIGNKTQKVLLQTVRVQFYEIVSDGALLHNNAQNPGLMYDWLK